VDRLKSDLFRGDQRLLAALNHGASHILPGSSGEHVNKIQAALLFLEDPPIDITNQELQAAHYGATTTAGVLRCKTAHNIINTAYQRRADNIVGKMTVRALDDALVAKHYDGGLARQIATAIILLISQMDRVNLRYPTTAAINWRVRFDRIGRAATRFGPMESPGGDIARYFHSGLLMIDQYAPPVPVPDDRPSSARFPTSERFLVAAAPVVAAAAGLTALQWALIVAILTLAAILIMCAISPQFRQRAEAIKQDVVAGMSDAIAENIATTQEWDELLERCMRIQRPPTPECAEAYLKYIELRNQLSDLRRELRGLIFLITSKPVRITIKADAEQAVELVKKMARMTSDLRRLLSDFWDKCGCRFRFGPLPS